MNKDEITFRKRLVDLSNQAFSRNIVIFSDFLNLNELTVLHTTPKNMFPARYETYGGYEFAERQMVAFLPDALYYEYKYPISVIEITPLNEKFAEKLTHRDYLGALMSLGLDRSRFGDILVEDEFALLFAHEEIAGYVTRQLSSIRHTSVTARIREPEEISYKPSFQTIRGNVPSLRLDAVISSAFPMSRSKMIPYIEGGKVFVNGKQVTSNAYKLKDGDIISVRGLGRIIYDGVEKETKKGRSVIRIRKF